MYNTVQHYKGPNNELQPTLWKITLGLTDIVMHFQSEKHPLTIFLYLSQCQGPRYKENVSVDFL